MISSSQILKSVQTTLLKKMRMLNKGENTFNIGEPLTEEGGDPQSNYMFSRTVMLRMSSLLTLDNKPVILTGGEQLGNSLQSSMGVYGPRSNFVDMGTPETSDSQTGKTVTNVFEDLNTNMRPIAGVKDVSVEYVGGGMKIGATRQTTINWTCWTWEELQKFKPFFLTHSKTVLVEFGWSFEGPDAPHFLDIINEDGTLNKDTINGTEENPGHLQSRLADYIKEQNGHYDAVLGTIKNFQFSVNETGGFDCSTELSSMGVSALNKMNEPNSMKGQLSQLPISKPVDGYWWFSKDKAIIDSQLNDKNPYYSFDTYVKSLEGHLHLNAEKSKGSIAYLLGNDEPYCTWGWFEDNVLCRFVGQINEDDGRSVTEFRSLITEYDENEKPLKIPTPVQFNASKDIIAVDYSPSGWFFAQGGSDPSKGQENEKNSQLIPGMGVYTEFEQGFNYGDAGSTSTGRNNWFVNNFTALDAKMGEFKMMFGPPFVQESNQFTGQWKGAGWKDGKPWELQWKKTFLGSETAKFNGYTGSYFRRFLNHDEDKGNLRNVYFGHKFLTECFTSVNTISEGIDSVWSKFSSAYGGIYNFYIDFDDREGRLMVKERGYGYNRVRDALLNKSNRKDIEYDLNGLFVFPIWEKNSMVKSQNLDANIPNRMQIAAMYGNRTPDSGDGEINGFDDWSATALAKSGIMSDIEQNRDAKYSDVILGKAEFPFKSHRIDKKTGEQIDYSFGNPSAEDSTAPSWKVGKSPNTTDIYLDPTVDDIYGRGGELNTDNDEAGWGRGMNEVLDDQLKAEYMIRLKEEFKKIDTTGLNESEIQELKVEAGISKKSIWATIGNTLMNPIDSAVSYGSSLVSDTQIFGTPEERARKLANEKEQLFKNKSGGYVDIFNKSFVSRMENNARYKPDSYPRVKSEYVKLMKNLIRNANGSIMKTTDPVIPSIKLEIEIDGTGGIFPGNLFHSSYLPNAYIDKTVFETMGSEHKIDSSGWTTTLRGQMRVAGYPKVTTENPDYSYDPDLVPLDPEEKNLILQDPNAEVEIIEFPNGVKVEAEKAIASAGSTSVALPPLYPEQEFIGPSLPKEKKADSVTVSSLFGEEDETVDKGYTQIMKLGDADVTRGLGNITKKRTDGTVKDLDGNLYKPDPAGNSRKVGGVKYNDQTTGFSDSVSRWFDWD